MTYFIHSREVTKPSTLAKPRPQATATGPIHSRGQDGHGERAGRAGRGRRTDNPRGGGGSGGGDGGLGGSSNSSDTLAGDGVSES